MGDTSDTLHALRVSGLGVWIVIAYGAFLGGAVGSFLNVVAYRLPLGMSLSRPGSRCPRCEHPIRWYHNIPVLGWLLLGGRCYDCGLPISPRYPRVEFLVALAGGIVCAAALRQTEVEGETFWLINLPAVVLRLVIVCLLFCLALLEFDGNRRPFKLFLVSVLLITLAVVAFPHLRIDPPAIDSLAIDPPAPPEPAQLSESFASLAFPFAAALVLSLLAWPAIYRSGTRWRDAATYPLALGLVAVGFGGGAVMFVAAACAFWMILLRGLASLGENLGRCGCGAALVAATLAWVILAGPALGTETDLVRGDWFISLGDRWRTLGAVGLMVAALSVLGRVLPAPWRRVS